MDKIPKEDMNISKFKYDIDINKREKLLNQRSIIVWITGLSGSGKSTIANALNNLLYQKKYISYVLDADNLRSGLNSDLGFSLDDRNENIRRVSELCRFFIESGLITIVPIISPLQKHRSEIKRFIGNKKFFEVYLSTSLDECIKRDTKGLYKKALNNEIDNFTGISSPYEIPVNPDIKIDTEITDLDNCVEIIFNKLISKIIND